jgi:hypothetical protein
MSVTSLFNEGVINYLYKNGIISSSIISYMEYFKKFSEHRNSGKSYRESIHLISMECHVSETTVKKAVRMLQND